MSLSTPYPPRNPNSTTPDNNLFSSCSNWVLVRKSWQLASLKSNLEIPLLTSLVTWNNGAPTRFWGWNEINTPPEKSGRFFEPKVHPWRLTWNIILEVWLRWFSFPNGWFVGSILIFQGAIWRWMVRRWWMFLFQTSDFQVPLLFQGGSGGHVESVIRIREPGENFHPWHVNPNP